MLQARIRSYPLPRYDTHDKVAPVPSIVGCPCCRVSCGLSRLQFVFPSSTHFPLAPLAPSQRYLLSCFSSSSSSGSSSSHSSCSRPSSSNSSINNSSTGSTVTGDRGGSGGG